MTCSAFTTIGDTVIECNGRQERHWRHSHEEPGLVILWENPPRPKPRRSGIQQPSLELDT